MILGRRMPGDHSFQCSSCGDFVHIQERTCGSISALPRVQPTDGKCGHRASWVRPALDAGFRCRLSRGHLQISRRGIPSPYDKTEEPQLDMPMLVKVKSKKAMSIVHNTFLAM